MASDQSFVPLLSPREVAVFRNKIARMEKLQKDHPRASFPHVSGVIDKLLAAYADAEKNDMPYTQENLQGHKTNLKVFGILEHQVIKFVIVDGRHTAYLSTNLFPR